jgi:FMN phosphatase YigB (HAD superfamily)
MALTLEQYAEHLDTRADLNWPEPPHIRGTKSKPHLKRLDFIKAVTWNVYGTLLSITGGEFYREHPKAFIMELALDKAIQEFKMWKAMSRKPGEPARLLRTMIENITLDVQLHVEKGERYPETPVEKIWEGVIKKLLLNEYSYNVDFFGSVEDYSIKMAYFFHRSLQGTGCDEGAAETVQWIKNQHYWQGLLSDAQCFTTVQLQRGLMQQDRTFVLDYCIPQSHRSLSHSVRAKKPSDRLFKDMVLKLRQNNIKPEETLHIGSDLVNDLAPAKKHGFITCLFTGDVSSLRADPELINDRNRPDVLITDFREVIKMLSDEAA